MDRLIIVGKGFGSGLAPQRPKHGTIIMGVNNVAMDQYADMIIDMHDLEWTEEECFQYYDHLRDMFSDEELRRRAKSRYEGFQGILQYVKMTNKSLLSIRKYKGLPTSMVYPLETITRAFDCDLFTSTVAYGIAWGLFQQFKRIDLYGINCLYAEEWAYQREAIAHWLGIAKGLGVQINVTGEEFRVLRSMHGLYGYNLPQRERGVKSEDMWIAHKDQYTNPQEAKTKEDLVLKKKTVWLEGDVNDDFIQPESG